MSGPKYHHFDCDLRMTINAFSNEQLNRICSAVKEDYKYIIETRVKINSFKDSLKSRLRDIQIELKKRIEEYKTDLKKVKKIKNEYLKEIDNVFILPSNLNMLEDYEAKRYYSDPYYLALHVDSVKQKMKDLKLFSELIEEKKNLFLADFLNDVKKYEKKEHHKSDYASRLEDAIIKKETIDLSKYSFVKKIETKLDDEEIKKISDTKCEMEESLKSKYIPLFDIGLIKGYIEKLDLIVDKEFDVSEKREIVSSTIENYTYIKEKIVKNEIRYNELFFEYDDLCSKLNVPKKENIKTIEEIEKALEEINEKIESEFKPAYISKTISEVMNELGYSSIPHEALKSEGELFTYDYESAISIYQNNEGMVMMELVSTKDTLMDDSEKELFLDKMERFCLAYPDILEKLKEKGIFIKKLNEMPIEKEFIRQVATSTKERKNTFKESNVKHEIL